MSRRETKSLPLLLLLTLPRPSAGAAEAVPVPSPEPSLIRIAPHLDPVGRAARAREEEVRRAALVPVLASWCRAYAPASRPLRAALGEAWDSLERGWGPASRNLGYPVREALRPVAALPPLPDPLLDRQLRRAFLYIEEGAQACAKGMPMTARLRWAAGLTALSSFESSLAALSGECALPPAAAFTVVLGEEVGDPYASGAATAEPSGPPGHPATEEGQQGSAKSRSRRSPGGSKKPAPGAGRPRRPR